MPRLRVRLFGRAVIEVDDRAVELTPTSTVVFIRLLIAGGIPVTVDEMHRDIWPDSGSIDREGWKYARRLTLTIPARNRRWWARNAAGSPRTGR
jgi:hypothetical protein